MRVATLMVIFLFLSLSPTWAQRPATRKIPLLAPLSNHGLVDVVPYFRLEPDLERRKVNGRWLSVDERLHRQPFDVHGWLGLQSTLNEERLDLGAAEIFDAPWQVDPVSMNLPTAMKDTIYIVRKWLGLMNAEGSTARSQLVSAVAERVPALRAISFAKDSSIGDTSPIRNALQHGYLSAQLAFADDELALSADVLALCNASSPTTPISVYVEVPSFATSIVTQWLTLLWPHSPVADGQAFLVSLKTGTRGRAKADMACVVENPSATETRIVWRVETPPGDGTWTSTSGNAIMTWNPLQGETASPKRSIGFNAAGKGAFCSENIGLCWSTGVGESDATQVAGVQSQTTSSMATSTHYHLRPLDSCDRLPKDTSPVAVFVECSLNLEWPELYHSAASTMGMATESPSLSTQLPRLKPTDMRPLVQRVDRTGSRLEVVFKTLATSSTISTGKVVAICITVFFWMRRVRVSSNSTEVEDEAKQTLQERPHDWDYAIARSVLDPVSAYRHARAGYSYYTLDLLLFIMLVAAFIACAADGNLVGVSIDGSMALKEVVPFAVATAQRYHIFFYVLLSLTVVVDAACKLKTTIMAAKSTHSNYIVMYARWFINATMFGALYQAGQVCRGREPELPAVKENGLIALWEGLVMHAAGHVYAASAIILFMDWNTTDVFHTALVFVTWAVLALILAQHTIRIAYALLAIQVQHARAPGTACCRLFGKGHWWVNILVFLVITAAAVTLCVLGQLDLMNAVIDLSSTSTEEADMWKFVCTALWLCALIAIAKITQGIVELYITAAARKEPTPEKKLVV